MEKQPVFEDTEFVVLKNFLHEKRGAIEEWSNMFFIEELSKAFLFVSTKSTKDCLIKLLSAFFNEIIRDTKTTNKVQRIANKLHDSVKFVVESRPASMIINNNIKKQSHVLVKDTILQAAYDDITNTQVEITESHITTEPQVESHKITEAQVEYDETPEPNKKRKFLKPSDLRALGFGEIVAKLNEYYGDKDVLDLTKSNIIPTRFKAIIVDVFSKYDLLLKLKLKDEEYRYLIEISCCKNKRELYNTVNDIDPFDGTSELLFLKLAVQKLCYILTSNVLSQEHREDWYRINIYGDLFDFIFSVKSGFETKRSECHSYVIKELKKMGVLPPEQKNVRLDFIFSHGSSLNDVFFCEDKPTTSKSTKDKKKMKYLREKALLLWSSLLPYEECIQYLSAISCQFNKLTLQITATKIIDKVIVHTKLKEVRIPDNEKDAISLGEYLSTLISLFRIVLENFEIIKLIIDIVKKDDLTFLSPTTIMNSNDLFRDDSITSDDSSTSSTTDNNINWQITERKLRIMEAIDTAITNFKKEAKKSYLNITWEEIFSD